MLRILTTHHMVSLIPLCLDAICNALLVPKAAQENLPKSVEDAVPNKIHDTGSSGSKSHATGPSMVPEGIQEVAPEALEKALPESIHPTKGSDIDPGPKKQ